MESAKAHTLQTAARTALYKQAVAIVQITAFTVCGIAWMFLGLVTTLVPLALLNTPQKALTCMLICAGIAYYRRSTGAYGIGSRLIAQIQPHEFARMGTPRPGGAIDSLVIEQAINCRLRELRELLESLQRAGRVTCTPTLAYSAALTDNVATVMAGNGQVFITFAYNLLYAPGRSNPPATATQLQALLLHEIGHLQCGHIGERQATHALTRQIRALLLPWFLMNRFGQKSAARIKNIAAMRWTLGLVIQLLRLILNVPLLPLRVAEAFERAGLFQADAEADAWAVTAQQNGVPLLEAVLDLTRRELAAAEKAEAEASHPPPSSPESAESAASPSSSAKSPGILARLGSLFSLEAPDEIARRSLAHHTTHGGRGHPGALGALLSLAAADLVSHAPVFRRCDELARLHHRLTPYTEAREEAS